MKRVLGLHANTNGHWVGDGFPVRTLFDYDAAGRVVSPFLLLDHAGPHAFTPTERPRGVGTHPHRGFETVTIVYDGEVAHRDSTGRGGTIGPGDVQWMTAGSGILHEEFHSPAFTRRGGTLEMVQLWVNLPAKHKMTEPRYQAILSADIPVVPLADAAGTLRVIAGDHLGHAGPARTFTDLEVWDVQLAGGRSAELAVPDGHTASVVVLRGAVRVNGSEPARDGTWVPLGRDGTRIALDADTDARVLLLGGEPIDEPIVGYGPFVMNSRAEIVQAMADFNGGRFGRIPT